CVRPFLDVCTSDLRTFLEQRGGGPYEDPANHELRVARVRVRSHILPALERDRPGITRRFRAAAAAAARWQDAAAREAAGPLTRSRLLAMPEPAAAEALKVLYAGAGGPDPGLSRDRKSVV